uniref:Uncharacterized protein n=1 Tax=Euplotes crassus TaxID=5936 RepID=A0A7S3NWJ4_EUPCR|mmetsp:Transcript_38379/g.37893  ORF Transcript_38379/g.37893 Transcript_38379/m.37893 type:complete len:111 (+) Transcript_38379:400-732(+)
MMDNGYAHARYNFPGRRDAPRHMINRPYHRVHHRQMPYAIPRADGARNARAYAPRPYANRAIDRGARVGGGIARPRARIEGVYTNIPQRQANHVARPKNVKTAPQLGSNQ